MSRRNKEKLKRHMDREQSQRASRRTGDPMTGAPAPDESQEKANPWIVWKTCLLYGVTAVIVAFVFAPWLDRYIQGQFFGLSGDYGTDFYRYSQGSVGWIRLGVDPYDNEQMFQAFAQGRLRSDHPHPLYDEQMAAKGFGPSPEPIAKGVVSPPFLLVLIYPLVRLCGYTLALNVWTVAGLLGISWLSVQFWRKFLPPQAPLWSRMASCAAMLSLLVLTSFPVLWSAIYGQFEVIYFLAIGGTIYLWVFQQNNHATPPLIGLLLAIGGAVKVFPLVMLGYFIWKVVLSLKALKEWPDQSSSLGPSSRPGRFGRKRPGLLALPELQVVLYTVTFFAAIHLLTSVVFGFDVYVSFFGKLGDLQVEGTGPSMKGNLLAYLNFAPIWLSDPFAPMTGEWGLANVAIAAFVVGVIAIASRGPTGGPTGGWPDSGRLTRRGQLTVLLEMTLILAALPTILPHWWIYYNVILILPLLACFVAAKETTPQNRRCWILALTALAFALTFSYLTTTIFFGAFPWVYDVLINRAGVDSALEKASAEPALLENLVYSASFGKPYPAEFEGRVVSLFNLLYGYPGTVFLLIANWLALRSVRRKPLKATAESHPSPPPGTSMRKTLIALAGGVLLSLAGGYAIIWEGERRLARASAQAPEVVFVTAEHSIKNPNQHVDQLLARLRTTAPKQGAKEWGGLVADLLPPHHFIEAVAKTDPALASAFLRQDRQFFEHPAAAASLVRLFARYQAELDKQYAAWFENGPPSNALAWRYHGHPGGLLEPLERKCRQQGVRLRRLDQDWMQWQLRFHYEYTWQRALQSLTAGDAIGFVRLLFEHKTSLHRHQAMIEEKVRRLRVSALYKAPQIDQWQAGLVYIQQPSFTALSTYASCRDLSEETPVETAVQIGVLYVMEELARRARVAKNGDPYEALTFAQTTVSQVNAAQIIALWSKEGANRPQETNGPKRILHYLSQSGVLDLNDVQAERLLMWDEPLR